MSFRFTINMFIIENGVRTACSSFTGTQKKSNYITIYERKAFVVYIIDEQSIYHSFTEGHSKISVNGSMGL